LASKSFIRLRAQKTRFFSRKKFCSPKPNNAYLCKEAIQELKTQGDRSSERQRFRFLTKSLRRFSLRMIFVVNVLSLEMRRVFTTGWRHHVRQQSWTVHTPELITNCINELARELRTMDPMVQERRSVGGTFPTNAAQAIRKTRRRYSHRVPRALDAYRSSLFRGSATTSYWGL
jgi:hypothetical protein